MLCLIPVYEDEVVLLKQGSTIFLKSLRRLGTEVLELDRPDRSKKPNKNKSGYMSRSTPCF